MTEPSATDTKVSGDCTEEPSRPASERLSRHGWRTRLEIFCTLPHAVFFTSLIVLFIFTTITIRSETSRQRKVERLPNRCAFVYLVASNQTHIYNLGASIKSLNQFFKFDFKYKIIIVHEDIPPVVRGRLQAVSEAPLHFRHMSLRPLLKNLVPVNFISNIDKIHPSEKQKYLQRCISKFWAYTALVNNPSTSHLFANLDYIVRLDQDWRFTAAINNDFLKTFVLSGSQYGHLKKLGSECNQNSTASLKELATSYVELNGITPRSIDLWNSIFKNPTQPCVPYFQTHFEIANLRFFRWHSGVQDWIRVVDNNGGVFMNDWKDHVLRFFTVALYAAPEKLVYYDEKAIPYSKIPGPPK